MKTKFFKKLSFVLALAMVISLASPAAGVFAATKVKLNSTKKYLHLGVDGKDKYNFNITSKKGKGWKYYWESSNEKVAKVNEKNGVATAAGVGTAKISVTIEDKDGEEVGSATATVVVRDNIKTVKISNPVEKLAVGEERDFNRSYTTVSGSTKKTSAITRWTVEPADGATIVEDTGVFVATKAGKYTVTARSFQSKAKYNDWKDNGADYVLAEDSIEITVAASIVGIKQVNKNTFTVEFDSSMADTDLSATTATVYQVLNGKLYNTGTEKIKALDLDATGKIATVEIYGNLVSEGEYQFVYGELKDGFTAANTDLSEIHAIIFDDFTVVTDGSTDMLDKVNAVNKAGIVIRSGHDIKDYLNFDYKGDVSYGWNDGNNAYINKNGYSGKFEVEYNNFKYNEETKLYDQVILKAEAMGTGIDKSLVNTTMQFAVVSINAAVPSSTDSDKWLTGGFKVPEGDNFNIYTRFKVNTASASDPYQYDNDDKDLDAFGKFTYISTDTDRMLIDGRTLFAAKQGVVTVLVKDGDNIVGAFDVQIVPARSYASAIPNTSVAFIGNHLFDGLVRHEDNETATFTITNKDTVGDPINLNLSDVEYKIVNAPKKNNVVGDLDFDVSVGSGDDLGKTFIKVGPNKDTHAGTYQIKVTTTVTLDKTVQRVNMLSVTVRDAEDTTPKSWKVEFVGGDSVDLKKQSGERDLTVKVYGYNAKGARVDVLDAADYTLIVKKGSQTIDYKVVGNKTKVSLAKYASGSAITTTGTALEFVDLGTYTVTAKAARDNVAGRTENATIHSETFTVNDTISKEVKQDKTTVSETKGTVYEAVKDTFTLKLDGQNVWNDNDATVAFKYTMGGVRQETLGGEAIEAGKSIYVDKIYVTKSWGNGFVTYTYDVNKSITVSK